MDFMFINDNESLLLMNEKGRLSPKDPLYVVAISKQSNGLFARLFQQCVCCSSGTVKLLQWKSSAVIN